MAPSGLRGHAGGTSALHLIVLQNSILIGVCCCDSVFLDDLQEEGPMMGRLETDQGQFFY